MSDESKAIEWLVQEYPWTIPCAAVIGFIIRNLKPDMSWIPINVQPRLRPIVSLALGLLCGVVAHYALHVTLVDSLVGGLISGGLPIVGHEVIVNSLLKGREILKPAPKTPASPEPSVAVDPDATGPHDVVVDGKEDPK